MLTLAAGVAALTLGSSVSLAQTEEKPAESPAPSGGTTVNAPAGSGGITVVAPTAGGGTVTASGCTTVVVNGAPTLIAPGGAPCPATAYPAYAPYAPAPPPTMPYYDVRPRYAPDPDRKAAVIGSAIGFGVGGGIAGIMYLVQYSEERDNCRGWRTVRYSDGTTRSEPDNCTGGGGRASLITYGAIVTFMPSIARFVVGDTTRGLIYTGLRGASFATAALVNWGDNSDTRWQGPFLLGFVAPITLGIIDLATTPHREDLVEKEKTGVTGIAPVAVTDRRGQAHGALFAVEGRF